MREVFVESYGEEAYGVVYELEDGSFSVYEIPQYGGEERHEGNFAADQFEAAKALAGSFT
jgi:hypothetical protein